jgi:hypothetical protein
VEVVFATSELEEVPHLQTLNALENGRIDEVVACVWKLQEMLVELVDNSIGVAFRQLVEPA